MIYIGMKNLILIYTYKLKNIGFHTYFTFIIHLFLFLTYLKVLYRILTQ